MEKKKNHGIHILVGIILICLFTLVAVLIATYKKGKSTLAEDDIYKGGVKTINQAKLNVKTEELTESFKITAAGLYNLSGEITDGLITINTNDNVVLNLTNLKITNKSGPAINVEKAKNVEIIVNETVELNGTPTEELNGAIYSTADLRIDGSGSLKITSALDGIVTKDDLEIDAVSIEINSEDDGIVGRDSVIVDSGLITINSKGDAIKSTNVEKGTIRLDGGTFTINTSKDAIQSASHVLINAGEYTIKTGQGSASKSTANTWKGSSDESIKGIKSTKNIYVTGGVINLDTEDDAIHSDVSVQIDGGIINISSGDDGIHASNTLNITNGEVNITTAYEGIEALVLNIDDGKVDINATDDGINVAGGNDNSSQQGRNGMNPFADTNKDNVLSINGGSVKINAAGDGMDSNGYIYITGGTVYVDGPTNSGNGALDYGIELKVTGGTLIAVGSIGMAENVSASSTQVSVRINLTSTYTSAFTFGNITYTPSKAYQSIVISSPDLKKGEKYNLVINGKTIQTITLTDTVNSFGKESGFQGGQKPGGPPNMNANHKVDRN